MQLVERVRNYLQLSEKSYMVDIINSIDRDYVRWLSVKTYIRFNSPSLYLWTKNGFLLKINKNDKIFNIRNGVNSIS